MTRRFTLALLVVMLALVTSIAPAGAEDSLPVWGTMYQPVTTGPCLLAGSKVSLVGQMGIFTDTGNPYTNNSPGSITRVRLLGNGFTVVNQYGLGQAIGRATCNETWSIGPTFGMTLWAFRVVSATFHGGVHLAPGTQMAVSFNRAGWFTSARSTYPNGYSGDYDITITNTVNPAVNPDWSTCGNNILPRTLNFTNGWGFTKWDNGRSKLTGDHNGQYWIDYTLAWAKC